MRVGLVSDTHGLFDPRLPEILAGCERILHAGDVMGADIVAALERIAPTRAVQGNNDRDRFGRTLPEVWSGEVGELRTLVIHQLGKPEMLLPAARKAIAAASPEVVIFGHSHQPAVERRDGILFVNPGSCGPRRFRLPRAAGRMEVVGRRVEVTIFDLEAPGLQALLGPAVFEL